MTVSRILILPTKNIVHEYRRTHSMCLTVHTDWPALGTFLAEMISSNDAVCDFLENVDEMIADFGTLGDEEVISHRATRLMVTQLIYLTKLLHDQGIPIHAQYRFVNWMGDDMAVEVTF